jgi:hypothetical protein
MFNDGFKDALIAGEEVYWVGVVGGEPVVRICNPLDITVIMDPDSDKIENAQAILEERWMTIGSVLDEFWEELTPAQIKSLETNAGRMNVEGQGINYPYSNFTIKGEEEYRNRNAYSRTHDDEEGTLRVLRIEWQSMRKVGFLRYIDEKGIQQEDIVDEGFDVPEGAVKNKEGAYEFDEMTLKWEWISEFWEGTKIGADIFVQLRPKPNQRRDMDNPCKCKSGYVGYIYNARNSESISLIDRMKPYQYFYNILYYRTELAFAKSKGKLMTMDVAQIPASEGWDVDKWMYYLETMGIAFINSFEEGPNGQQSNFNQFSAIDLTMGQFINQHVQMLSVVDNQVSELAGVTKQRLGQISTSELVGNTERAVIQSSHITESWFFTHDEVKKSVLEALLDSAKLAWTRKNKKLQYITDDMGRIMLDIDGNDFAMTETGVYVSMSTKDEKILESLRNLSQAAMQNGAQLSDVATMMQSESVAEIVNKLRETEREREQKEAEMQKQQQAFQEQAQKLEAQKIEREDFNKERDRETKIEVAHIQAESRNDGDRDNDGIPDNLEQQKLSLQERKLAQDQANKSRELGIKEKQANKKDIPKDKK